MKIASSLLAFAMLLAPANAGFSRRLFEDRRLSEECLAATEAFLANTTDLDYLEDEFQQEAMAKFGSNPEQVCQTSGNTLRCAIDYQDFEATKSYETACEEGTFGFDC